MLRAEIVIAVRIRWRILVEQLLEPVQRDDVDAHRGARQVVVADDGIGVLRLLRELDDAIGVVGGHDAEFLRAVERHVDDADGDVRLALLVIGDHRTVVHLVDVIAGEYQHVRRVVRADELEILVHRVGGAAVPVLADLLLSRNQLDEFAQLAAQIAPAALDVLDQRLRLVLSEHGDLADAGIHAIRQHEVDDAELAAERRRGLAAMQGQRLEALAAASGHDDRQCAARQSADVASGVGPSGVSHTLPASSRIGSLTTSACHTRQLAAPGFSRRISTRVEIAFARLAPMAPLKVCILSSEIMPFAKTGGLADVVGALVRELAQLGPRDPRLHAAVCRRAGARIRALQPVLGLQNVGVTIGGRAYAFSVRTAHVPGHRVSRCTSSTVRELFDRPSIYTRDPGRAPPLPAVHARRGRELPAPGVRA